MNKLRFSILLLLICFLARAQDNELDSINLLTVNNKVFSNVLSAVIGFEKQCNYYDSNINFIIDVQKVDIFIEIFSIIQIESIFGITKLGKEQGYFVYKGHTFIVSGVFEDKIFKKTDRKIKFNYEEIIDKYDTKTGEPIIESEDDSFTQWIYLYQNGEFTFKLLHSYCGDD